MFFFFNDTATTEIYTLSLHDALPIYLFYLQTEFHNEQKLLHLDFYLQYLQLHIILLFSLNLCLPLFLSYHLLKNFLRDRKSTRLNSSHANISYAVFCLKKKKI